METKTCADHRIRFDHMRALTCISIRARMYFHLLCLLGLCIAPARTWAVLETLHQVLLSKDFKTEIRAPCAKHGNAPFPFQRVWEINR